MAADAAAAAGRLHVAIAAAANADLFGVGAREHSTEARLLPPAKSSVLYRVASADGCV